MREVMTMILTALLMEVSTAAGQSDGNAVRPEHPDLKALLQTGVDRSPTFRELLTALRGSQVLVYVRFGRCLGTVPACLQIAPGAAASRRLVVKIDRMGHPDWELIALLAHELLHATEVAEAPWVTDAAGVQRLYEQRGWKGSHGFETERAVLVTRAVTRELAANR